MISTEDLIREARERAGAVPVARHYDRLLAETRRILTEGSDQ